MRGNFTLWKRYPDKGGEYYARWRGPDPSNPGRLKQYLRNTYTSDRREAQKIARELAEATWRHRFDALQSANTTQPERGPRLTIGELIARYERNAVDLTAKTMQGNIHALLKVVALGADLVGKPRRTIEALPAYCITAELVRRFQSAYLEDAIGNDGQTLESRRIGANSIRAQAFSVLNPELVGMAFPDARTVNPLRVEVPRFNYDRSLHLTISEALTELAESNPEAAKVIVLALGAGLRRAEIAAARYAWLTPNPPTITVGPTDTWKGPKSRKRREIPVTPQVYLFFGQDAPECRIVADPVQAIPTATAWLRQVGVKDRKPLHYLRKMFGSLVADEVGIAAASVILGHADLKTTMTHYYSRTGGHKPVATIKSL